MGKRGTSFPKIRELVWGTIFMIGLQPERMPHRRCFVRQVLSGWEFSCPVHGAVPREDSRSRRRDARNQDEPNPTMRDLSAWDGTHWNNIADAMGFNADHGARVSGEVGPLVGYLA